MPPDRHDVGPYNSYLAARYRWRRRRGAAPPRQVALVTTERDLLANGASDTMERFLQWAFEYGTERVAVSVSVLDEAVAPTIERSFREMAAPRPVAIRGPDDRERADAPIQVSVGLGGKREFAGAVRALAAEVAAGERDPTDIDADAVEAQLVFPDEPDLLIKTGAERLSDFLIWQSVYSELYFTDVNWRNFRRRDYLRALLDYQSRQRRFGR
jgi:undecaprenyl diphosphate synthase